MIKPTIAIVMALYLSQIADTQSLVTWPSGTEVKEGVIYIVRWPWTGGWLNDSGVTIVGDGTFTETILINGADATKGEKLRCKDWVSVKVEDVKGYPSPAGIWVSFYKDGPPCTPSQMAE